MGLTRLPAWDCAARTGSAGRIRRPVTTYQSNLTCTRYRPRNQREIRPKLAHGTHALQVYGAAGSGGIYRRAAAILTEVENVDVAVICGRNQRLGRRLSRLAERPGRPGRHARGVG